MEIVNSRCKNCNKPIGHLHDMYKTLIETHSKNEAFNLLNIKNFCCRHELEFPYQYVILPPKEKINKPKITKIKTEQELIIASGPQLSYKISSKQTALGGDLYLHYLTDITYLAQ